MHRPIKSLIRSTMLAMSLIRLLAGLADFSAVNWRKLAVLAGLALALQNAPGAIPTGFHLLAGSLSNESGYRDAQGGSALFLSAGTLVVDSSGNVFFADASTKIRKITATGMVSTLATLTSTSSLMGIDSSDFVYPIDQGNQIWKVNSSTGAKTQWSTVGSGPYHLSLDRSGTYAFLSYRKMVSGTLTVLRVNNAGTVETVVNSGINGANAAVVDPAGNWLYIAELNGHRILRVSLTGVLPATPEVFAGDGTWGTLDGAGTAARFAYPANLAIDSSGTNLYVVDNTSGSQGTTIRKIVISSKVVSTPYTGFSGLQSIGIRNHISR